jgi:Cu+-exporting ATPase
MYRSVTVDDEDVNSVFRKLRRATFRKIVQNPLRAFFYNIIIEPLTILGMMHPVLAEIAMAFWGIRDGISVF